MVTRRPVPVTIIGGAAAEGVAQTIAGPDDSIVAESWHGPGSVRIEADVAHRTTGCPCCALRLDVIDGLLRTVRRPNPPAHVLLIAGAGEDLTTIAYTVLSDADLARHLRLDSVIVALDGVAMTTRAAAGGALGTAAELEAVAIADRIMLDRREELTSAAVDSLEHSLRALNLIGSTIEQPPGRGTRTTARQQLIDLDAWHGAPAIAGRHTNDLQLPDGAPNTVVLRQHAPLDPDAVDEWLDRVIESHAPRLLRLQGALAVDSAPARVCCHGVRSFAMSHSELADPPASRRDESLVVLVGHGLDADNLSNEFAATRVR